MALTERLELDIAAALQGIGTVEQALGQAAQNFKTELAAALDVLGQVKVEADASAITSAIDDAVAAANTTADVTVDGGVITSEIDGALAAADAQLPVQADTSAMVGEIDAAVSSADAQVPVTAATDAIAGEIQDAVSAVDPQVTVTADTSGLADEISSAVADIPAVEIPVTADTSGAVSGLNDLTAATGPATSGLDGLKTAGEATQAGADALTGSFAGLGSTLNILGPEGREVGAVVGGLAAGIGVLIDKGVEADTAQRRVNEAFGGFAEVVRNTHVEGFAANLEDLGAKTGNLTSKLLTGVSTIGDMARSLGASQQQAAEAASQIANLAVRASVLNPTLGQAGDFVQRFELALQRGGARLGQYGLSLSTAEVNQRALAIALERGSAEVTSYDKTVAAAQLATERLGGSMKGDLEQGVQGAQVQMRILRTELDAALESFGRPLLAPFIEAMRNAQPSLIQLGKTFGDLGKVLIPAFADALVALAPGIKASADLLTLMLKPLLEIEKHPLFAKALELGITAVTSPLAIAAPLLDHFAGSAKTAASGADDLGTGAAGAAAPVGGMASALGTAADEAGNLTGALGPAIEAMAQAAQTAKIYQTITSVTTDPVLQLDEATNALAKDQNELAHVYDTGGKGATKAADSARQLEAAHREQAKAATELSDAERHLQEVQDVEIPAKLAELADKATKSTQELAKAELSLTDAQQKLNDLQTTGVAEQLAAANSTLEKATKGVTDAVKAEADARENLTHLEGVDIPRQLEEAQNKVTDSTNSLRDAEQSLADAQQKLNDLQAGYAESLDRSDISAERSVLRQKEANTRLTELRAQLAKLQSESVTGADAQTKKNADIAKTQDAIANAQLDIRDAALNEHDAQKALEDLRGPKHLEDIAKANNAVEDAQHKVTKATEAEADAQKALDDLRTTGIQKEIADAEGKIADAVDHTRDAEVAAAKAQADLNKLRDVTIPKELRDAEQTVADAQQAVEEKTKAAGKAQSDLTTAQSGGGEVAKLLETAQKAVATAQDRVASTGEAAARAIEHESSAASTSLDPLAKSHELVDKIAHDYDAVRLALIANQAPRQTILDSINAEILALQEEERQTPSTKGQVDLLVTALLKLRDDFTSTVKLNGDDAVLKQVDDLVKKLGDIPGISAAQEIKMILKDIEIAGPAADKLVSLQKLILGLEPGNNATTGASAINDLLNPTKFMAGGEFGPNQWILTGDAGPELMFTGPNAGWVLNNQQTTDVLSGGGFDMARLEQTILRVMENQRPIIVNEVANDPEATARAVSARQGMESKR